MLKTASFIVPSGTYQISLHANRDLRISYSGGSRGMSKEVADADVSLNIEGGHTYVPNARIQGDRIQFFFDDKGKNYPMACLPLYVTVNNSSNPGLKLYSTDEKCEI
jgi:hypothetical protein